MNNEIKENGYYNKYFIVSLGLLTVLWLIFLFVGDGNQLSIFYKHGKELLGDFLYRSAAYKDPYNWETGSLDYAQFLNNPPLGYIIQYPFNKLIEPNSVLLMTLLLFTVSFLLIEFLIFDNIQSHNKIQKYIIAILFFFSSIVLGAYERGNIIVIAAVFSLFFLFGFDSDDENIRELSYIALAISAGIKLYPAVFGLLILKRKRYKEAVRAIIYGMFFFFIPFLFFKGGFQNIPLLIRNIGLFSQHYRYANHPAFNFKFFANGIVDEALRENVYMVFFIIDKIMILLAVFSVFLTKVKWKEILIISMSIIWFSLHSGYYMGLFFLAGMVCFLNEANKSVLNNLCLIFIVLILNPLQIVLPNGYNLTCAAINISASSLAGIMIISVFADKFRSKIDMKINNSEIEKITINNTIGEGQNEN